MDFGEERDKRFERALEEGNLNLVKKLLEEGKSLSSWNANHWTPLCIAIAKQNSTLVRLFLEKGAEVNLANECNLGTPLHCAVEVGRCDFVELLLKNGAEVDIFTHPSKNTPLFMASEGGHCDIVEALLANKAEVNLPNDKNEIALDIACQNGHLDVVKTLLDNGANVNWSGKWEGTPLLYACEGHFFNIVKLLLDRGADINPIGCSIPLHTPLYHAALYGFTEVFKLLLERGANINETNENLDTPLHGACYKGHEFLVKKLLGMGAEVNRQSLDRRSPLYLACAAGHSSIVKMLLDRGADVDEDIDGAWDLSWHTPLYMAFREGHREMISWLLSTDTDFSYPYDKGDPIGKAISEVRTSFLYNKMMHLKTVPLNFIGKQHASKMVSTHLTKLKVAGLAEVAIVEEEQDFVKCTAELECINSFEIFENISLGIVFQKAKFPLYQRNEKLMKKLEDYLYSPLPRDEFPMYACILRNTLEKSKRKFSQLTAASKILQEYQPKLPILVLEQILKYLDDTDLKIMSNLV